ncbi:NADP-binding protein [Dacryopinax primogenitus]|uniref:NADP-binding protein n=1 Tax=Dacryopinax primogenitus (strain DJM 731) TaxID=1858805 RepID=M5G8D5_DACPD|nr:NADP-binding protein [Dacryopinax primogenitus]EJU06476.1 NADP-binding protein [Dacryopinax primogenitus]
MSSPQVIITGASKGIGLATAQVLLEVYDAKVVSISRSTTPELEALKAKFGDKLVVVLGDVSDPEVSLEALKVMPSPTGLVLNAAICLFGRVEKCDPSDWRKTFELNVFSLFHTLVPAIPALRENKGRVVFVSSGSAVGKTTGMASYNASKAAMNAVCRTFANEEPDIASFAVHPGMVETEMQLNFLKSAPAHLSPAEADWVASVHSSGQLVKPEDSGYVLASLVVKGSSDLSGQFFSWNSPEAQPYMKK